MITTPKEKTKQKKNKKKKNGEKAKKTQQKTKYKITTTATKNKLSHAPFRHNIVQMTSTSKAYIPCLLATVIK